MRVERIDSAAAPGRARAGDLALVGEVATLLDPADATGSLDAALDRLREGTLADACELFLTDPDGREMYLVSHRGADLEAFCQRDRFERGEGFPGIVLRTGAALATDSLEAEADFLRGRVKARRYRGLVCVPVRCAQEVLGSLLLAWKRSDADLEGAMRTAVLASRPILFAVTAASGRLRLAALEAGADPLGEAAERLRAAARADAAAIRILAPAADGPAAACAGGSTRTADGARRAVTGNAAGCPAAATRRAQVLGGREGWPAACLHAGCLARGRYCVPLVAADRVLGIATVAFHDVAPVPRTRWLPLVLTIGRDLPLLIEAPPCRPPVAVQNESASSARLRVRCFGGFEITLEGRPLPRHAFARRKAWELLALLVAASGRPLPAAVLAERLWPGVPPGRGLNRVHVTLSALRSVIEPAGRPWTHIRFQDTGFYLEPQSSVSVDVWRYDELRKRARSAEAQMRPVEEVAALLEEAVAIYTADPFEGAVSADWVEALAARYREDVLSALADLAALWRELGATARAAWALERAACLNPGRRPGRGP